MVQKPFRTQVRDALLPKVPRALSRNFRSLDEAQQQRLTESLNQHYFSLPENRYGLSWEDYQGLETARSDMQTQMLARLEEQRATVAPWLHQARPLAGLEVLEIGCGTGCSTVALAEQGARVTAIDINESSLAVARERCALHGLEAEFQRANAEALQTTFGARRFDAVVLVAVLEHMTLLERLSAMNGAWELLRPGGLWVCSETPNRLWYFDDHTSLLPFYSWLPDDLAFRYSRFSPRSGFNAGFREATPEAALEFLRQGRGVSYHEFDLTLGKAQELNVVSSLPVFLRERSPFLALRWRLSIQSRYEAFLRKVGPPLHPGFYQSSLYLVIQKPGPIEIRR